MSTEWDSEFAKFRTEQLDNQISDLEFRSKSKDWFNMSVSHKYSYQFDWLGVPIIQMPSDLILFQEIVWDTQPDLIIETGIARGGSLVFWSSVQNLCGIDGKVIGIDIDVRTHARNAISSCRFSENIIIIEGSSVDQTVVEKVHSISQGFSRIMVVLDSNHSKDHVLKEMNAYSNLVTKGNYLLVLDTSVEIMEVPLDRPWGPGNSPGTAVDDFLKVMGSKFKQVNNWSERSVLSMAHGGFLRRV